MVFLSDLLIRETHCSYCCEQVNAHLYIYIVSIISIFSLGAASEMRRQIIFSTLNLCEIIQTASFKARSKNNFPCDFNILACLSCWHIKDVCCVCAKASRTYLIQQLVHIKWDISVHGRDLYLLKPTLGPPKKFQYLTRAEEVVITRLRIGHTKATKSHILSRGPPTICHHCGQTLTIDHMLLECAALQEIQDEYYTADSLKTLFEKIPETCIVEFLREAGFFYLIWIVKDYKL